MSFVFTEAQRNAIGLHALDSDTCVVAGPGSGKTTVLIERFRALVDSGVSPLRILAITFTEKATLQMRERLAEAFAGRPDLILQIQRAWVSTVHGFCTRLLRENAILAGVDPRFRVLDEQEAFALQRKSVADALDLFLTESPGPARDLLRALYSPDLGDSILGVYDALRCAGMPLASLELPRRTGGRAVLNSLAAHCDRILDGNFSDWKPSQKEQLDSLSQWRGRLRERAGAPLETDDFRILSRFPCNLNKIRRNNPAYDGIKQLKDDLIPAAGLALADDFHAVHRAALLEAMGRFDALYRARKHSESALDFSDLEEYSVRLLEENEEARQSVRRQFDHVLMDEFQDTNGLQSKLLDLLRPADRFYAVGDINQSIYGFRHADPRVFDEYRAALVRGGKHLAELRENWRSRPEILRAVSSLLEGREGIERHKLPPARKFRRKTQPSVELIRALGEDGDQAQILEAKWIARRVAELEGTLLLESGPAHFGDMAVLVRKADSIQPLAAAFGEAGIPYTVTAGKGFFESSEVRDLTHLLRVLANPRDEISLAAVLRSPLAGVSDATLLRFKQQGSLAGSLEAADGAAGAFYRELAGWRELRHSVSPDRLLIRAMDRCGYELALGPRERLNIEKLLAMVREAGARRPLDVLVEELERLRESDPREQDSQAEFTGDAVRVLTIHTAKGLEFPIVFLPALQAGLQNSAPPALLSPRLGLGVCWRNPATGRSAKDSLYDQIRKERQQKEDAESNRVLYVAMTRAEEHLVLSCSGKLQHWATYPEASWGVDLQSPRETPEERTVTAPGGGAFALRVLCTSRAPEPARQLPLLFQPESCRQARLPAVRGQYDSAASVTSVALFAECPRRYYLARYLGFDGERPRPVFGDEDEPAPEAPDAGEFGRQVHALLAGADRTGADPLALALAGRFEASDIGARAARAGRREREFDFLTAVEDVVLRGQIDLWFEESGELVLVDYKTDNIPPEEARSRAGAYGLQLQLYAIALERMTGRPPDRALLYFLRPDVAVPVALDSAGAVEAVRGFRRAQEALDFPLREEEHCRRCPFLGGMCPARVA
ncbi:MAG TPA: UvrD-helicase domain-containing protein [Bryobacteraceae bacterium]|nr:UvrD-helicase domain-containing protein [Bryobacteraceae bacterium]